MITTSKQIDIGKIKSIFVRENGWVEVDSIEEVFFTIGVPSHTKAGKKAWSVVTKSGELLTLTPAMIEAVTE